MVYLNRPYGGYAAGVVAEFDTATESSLIAQGLAVSNAGPVTAGAFSTNANHGQAVIAAGQGSLVISNPNITANSVGFAYVSQATADGTLLRVERIVFGAGTMTIYGTANATANTVIKWAFGNVPGTLTF